MKKTSLLFALCSLLFLTACMYGNHPNSERFFANADITQVDWTEVNARGSACQWNWFGLIPTGSNSLPRAVENADIARLAFVDTDTIVFFPLFIAECTNVWGVKTDAATEREARIATEREARRAARRPLPTLADYNGGFE
ncbi:MAG: TRL-like family protein [Alphaproteobacteria bacterium]|nr:TRL-like family protein [Alphaproteobacteria bacterium]